MPTILDNLEGNFTCAECAETDFTMIFSKEVKACPYCKSTRIIPAERLREILDRKGAEVLAQMPVRRTAP